MRVLRLVFGCSRRRFVAHPTRAGLVLEECRQWGWHRGPHQWHPADRNLDHACDCRMDMED